MDLAVGAKKLIIAMNHVTKDNQPRIVKKCSYELTAVECVKLVVTDIAVIEVTKKGNGPQRGRANLDSRKRSRKLTEPKLIVAPDCREIEL